MATIQDLIRQTIKTGERQALEGMFVFPLFCSAPTKLSYLSLKQALQQQLIMISEISQGGSVPNLKAVNNAPLPVLLLDGEEISGAKQNRILNTSILLMEKSETIIPVSCTERGRWSYNKPIFEESGNIMMAEMRADKLSGVTSSLKSGAEFRSDQGKVWADIDAASQRMGVHSPTSALKDVYAGAEDKVQNFLKAFSLMENQCGIAVCYGSRLIGLDFVSLPSVWADLHTKLVKSYAMEFVMGRGTSGEPDPEVVSSFLERLLKLYPEVFKSVGYGEDYRFSGSESIGSALYWQDTIIHLEAYSRSAGAVETPYHSPRQRHTEFS